MCLFYLVKQKETKSAATAVDSINCVAKQALLSFVAAYKPAKRVFGLVFRHVKSCEYLGNRLRVFRPREIHYGFESELSFAGTSWPQEQKRTSGPG